MHDSNKLTFTIPGFTPETMPFPRLLEYLNQLRNLLGHTDGIHLVDIRKSSTAPVFDVDMQSAENVERILREVANGQGSEKQRKANIAIQQMINEDAASDKARPATIALNGDKIIEFAANQRDENIGAASDYRPIIVDQPTTVAGTLVQIGSQSKNPNPKATPIVLREVTNKLIRAHITDQDLAREIATHLYQTLRCQGMGKWERNSQGKWNIKKLQIQSYERVEVKSFAETIAALQAVADATADKWPEDWYARLLALREDGEDE